MQTLLLLRLMDESRVLMSSQVYLNLDHHIDMTSLKKCQIDKLCQNYRLKHKLQGVEFG